MSRFVHSLPPNRLAAENASIFIRESNRRYFWLEANMQRRTGLVVALAMSYVISMPDPAPAQMQGFEVSPAFASGTLNIVLANKNGIVIAADSRMSSSAPFSCGNAMQLYCDNSQKLFRTGERSAIVIAGFAVGRRNSPLDLTLASVLR
jgi:hypothetical protein